MKQFNIYTAINSFIAFVMAQVFAASTAYAAYTIPTHYECAEHGYYNVLTEPADIPADYTGAVTLHPLPKNVCVKRLADLNKDNMENFTKFGLIPIEGAALKPLKGVTYNSAAYEPLVGHFIKGKASTTDFTGKHPVLIHKQATAAVRVEKGIYYFDKQSKIGDDYSTAVCPNGYSTVGSSKICYSKTNGLRLNSYNKVELITLKEYFTEEELTPKTPDEKCPLGYTMDGSFGSNGGICLPVKMVLFDVRNEKIPNANIFLPPDIKQTVQDYGISLSTPGECAPLKMSQKAYISDTVDYTSKCMPVFTAVTCEIDEASRAKFPQSTYPGKLAIAMLDTQTVDANAEFPTRLANNINKLTQTRIDVSAINAMLALFPDDEEFILPSSATTSGSVPIWALHTGTSCATFWAEKMKEPKPGETKGGYSLEPYPTSW
jgi:hypothetical protein